MTRLVFILCLMVLLTGCGWNPAPAIIGAGVIPAVIQADDGTLIEWHDFSTRC